jgi:hypothetical protein
MLQPIQAKVQIKLVRVVISKVKITKERLTLKGSLDFRIPNS